MESLKDELHYLFSGQGMPYEKVALMVAMVVTVVLTVLMGNDFVRDARVVVIDLDNSRYSHEIIDAINASEYMEVTAVLNTPVDTRQLFYQDRSVAAVCLPKDLEKNRYTADAGSIGVFYDNTNTAQTANIKEALNSIVATENAADDEKAAQKSILLHERNLFNPASSTSNGETQGFLFFFSSMFFTFATIGMIPRLRLSGKLSQALAEGNPFCILLRILPYGGCLLTALFLGMAILRIWGDMVFTGHVITFLFTQVCYIFALGVMCLIMGWTASNPGIASSRMILFIPGGFILGGATGPVPILSGWVVALSHIFPLTWEFHFVRDIVSRGAGLADISQELGAFFVYTSVLLLLFCLVFYRERQKTLAQLG